MDGVDAKPIYVQKDLSVLLQTGHPAFHRLREELAKFADLVKSPDYVHTYRMTPLTLWVAAASGIRVDDVLDFLHTYSAVGIPAKTATYIRTIMERYGMLRLIMRESQIVLVSSNEAETEKLQSMASLAAYFSESFGPGAWRIEPAHRGNLKRELTNLGYPVVDLAGFHRGEPLQVDWNCSGGERSASLLRDYQQEAVDAFCRTGREYGGSGVIVLPCGAGKTIVGIGVMARLRAATLILTTHAASVRQWKNELLKRTTLSPEQIGEYSGAGREVKPVTIATYQMITHRGGKKEDFPHLRLFNERDWGLIVYDEVHLLPAPVFRVTADIQATRRLGLTATLVREDGCEEDVFSLVGPKRYDAPWKLMEAQGWIAKVTSTEIRVPMTERLQQNYREAGPREKYRIAALNPCKTELVRRLLERHEDEPALIIGQYLDQLEEIASALQLPLVNGNTPHEERERIYRMFRENRIRRLVVSKVANFALDLPDASVAIQVSGSFGSRQEEAQRLGRILRPKNGRNEASFYSLVTRETKEQEFALKRRLFLVEQGYSYRIEDAETLLSMEGEPCTQN